MSSICPWIRVALGAIVLSWARGHGPSSFDSVAARAVGNHDGAVLSQAAVNDLFAIGAEANGPENTLGTFAPPEDSSDSNSPTLPRGLRRRAMFANTWEAASRGLALSGDADSNEGRESAGIANDPGHHPENRRRVSVISREDELYRAKYGAAAYDELLRQRHREEMSVAGMLPDPSRRAPTSAPSENPSFPVASSSSNGSSGSSGEPGVSGVGIGTTTTGVPEPMVTDSGTTPASSGFPIGVVAPPMLRIVPRPGGREISVEGAPLSGWTIERADTLRDPRWQTVGTTGADGRIRFDASASESGFWRVRSSAR